MNDMNIDRQFERIKEKFEDIVGETMKKYLIKHNDLLTEMSHRLDDEVRFISKELMKAKRINDGEYDYDRNEEAKPIKVKVSVHEKCKKMAKECKVSLVWFVSVGLFMFCKYLDKYKSGLVKSKEGISMSVKEADNYMHDVFMNISGL